jgi:hypothetical protein
MDFFVYNDAGEILNCIVAENAQIAGDVSRVVFGARVAVIERKAASREADIGDAFDKNARTFVKRVGGRQIPAPVDSAELVRE